nr:unnamed protein product [Callosobruchus chinensis]
MQSQFQIQNSCWTRASSLSKSSIGLGSSVSFQQVMKCFPATLAIEISFWH